MRGVFPSDLPLGEGFYTLQEEKEGWLLELSPGIHLVEQPAETPKSNPVPSRTVLYPHSGPTTPIDEDYRVLSPREQANLQKKWRRENQIKLLAVLLIVLSGLILLVLGLVGY